MEQSFCYPTISIYQDGHRKLSKKFGICIWNSVEDFLIMNCFLWLWTMPAAMKSSLLACSFLLLNQCYITNEIECVLSANVRMHHFSTFLNSAALECTLFSVSGVLGMTGCPACRLFLDLSLEGVNLDC